MESERQATKLSPFKSQGKAERRRQKGMRRGKREEEKTTATELCRGFNQPNYSLITETRNLEQLTHTHKDTHPITHMCNRSQLTVVTIFHR